MKLWLIDSDPRDMMTIKAIREVAKLLPAGQESPPTRLAPAYAVVTASVEGPAFFGVVTAEEAKVIQEAYTGTGQLILKEDDWEPEEPDEDESLAGPSEEAYRAALVALSASEGNPVGAIGVIAMLRNATHDPLYDEATGVLLDVFLLGDDD